MSKAPTKAAVTANQINLIDRIALRTSASVGHLVNNTESVIAVAPLGYQAARAKHDINARIAAAKAYAATL
jgi:hypothetical protein